MTRREFTDWLGQYPAEMPIRILINPVDPFTKPVDMELDNIMVTSDTAYVNEEAPEDEWDCEDGKVELGDGERYLLINPIIV